MANREANLDDLDYRLIALLRTDARSAVAKLAAALNVSRATVKARMDRLVKDGVIAGFTIILHANTDAPSVRAVTMIEVEGKNTDGVVRRLTGIPEITALHTTNGRWDIVAEIETRTLGAFDDLLRTIRQIDGIATTETSILLTSRKATK